MPGPSSACHPPNTAVDEEARLEATLSASRLLVSARRNLYFTNGPRLPEMRDVVFVKGYDVCRSESVAAAGASTARGCVEGVLASLETNMAVRMRFDHVPRSRCRLGT